MPPDRFSTCEYHLQCEKDASALRNDHENLKRSQEQLWVKFDIANREVQQHSGKLDPMDRDLQDLKKKVELKSEEERAYQVLVRNTRKDVEKIQDKMDSDVQEIHNKLNKVPTKEEVPTKESVEDLKKWVRYAWLATIFAVLALLANLALVIIPMVWKKGP